MRIRRIFSHSPFSLALLAIACSAPTLPPPGPVRSPPALPSPTASAPCVAARALRLGAPKLLAAGKLARAVRVLQRADALCPAEAAGTAASLASALAELDQPGDGRALIEAGLAAKRAGKLADAQRLFDRGLRVLERATGATAALTMPDGFAEPLGAVAWSGGGSIAAAQGAVIALVDGVTLRERARLTGHSGEIGWLAFSSDGAVLASASLAPSGDGTLRLWDVSAARERRKIDFPALSAALSPDGTRLAATGVTAAKVWDAATGRELATLPAASSLAFFPDGRRLALLEGDTVRIRDAESAKVLATFAPKKGDELQAVALSPDGRRLAAVSAHVIRLWDMASKRSLGALTRDDWSFCGFGDAAFSPDGGRLATIERERQGGSANAPCWAIAAVRDVVTGKLRSRFQAPVSGADVVATAFSPDAARLVSSSAGAASFDIHEQTLDVWDATTGDTRSTVGRRPLPVEAAAVSADGRLLVLAAADESEPGIHLWDTGPAARLKRVQGRDPLELSADGARLVVAAPAGAPPGALLVDVASGAVLATLGGDARAFPPSPPGSRPWSVALEPPLHRGEPARGATLSRTADGEVWALVRVVRGGGVYALTPEGFAEVRGEAALEGAACRVGPWSFPLEVCEERLIVPGLLGKLLAGDTSFREP